MEDQKKEYNFNPDEVKNAMVNAVIAMEGCKYVLVSFSSDKEQKVLMHQECSPHQLALIVKGILSQNEMLMMDVLSWCTTKVQEKLESKKKRN